MQCEESCIRISLVLGEQRKSFIMFRLSISTSLLLYPTVDTNETSSNEINHKSNRPPASASKHSGWKWQTWIKAVLWVFRFCFLVFLFSCFVPLSVIFSWERVLQQRQTLQLQSHGKRTESSWKPMEKVNRRKFADTPINYSTITTRMMLSYRVPPGAQQVFLYSESENGISYSSYQIIIYSQDNSFSYKLEIHYLVLLNFQGRMK